MTTRCLLMAANYVGTNHALQGCINDAENLSEFLVQSGFVDQKHITLIKEPKHAQILDGIKSLAEESNEKYISHIFVSYSGHGTYMQDTNGDEVDGQDEALVPVDFRTAGMVSDDDLCEVFAQINPSTRVSVLLDCCHSGTALDLPFKFVGSEMSSPCGSGSRCHPKTVMISGCKDAQTSADAYDQQRKEYSGAMTSSLLDVLKVEPTIGCDAFALVAAMRVLLKERNMSQIPQLCASQCADDCPNPRFLPQPKV